MVKKDSKFRAAQTEAVRGNTHTLDEHHEDLLSTSFDISYQGSADGRLGLSSSQFEANFYDDDIFALPSDGLDIGGLAEELAEELGWVDASLKNTERCGCSLCTIHDHRNCLHSGPRM